MSLPKHEEKLDQKSSDLSQQNESNSTLPNPEPEVTAPPPTTIDNKDSEEKKENANIVKSLQKKVSIDDFKTIKGLGKGSYAEVVLAKKIENDQLVAIKKIDKKFMSREKKEYQVFVEKAVLSKLNHPGLIKLYSTFQNQNKLFFVIEYMSGGEFSDFLRVHGKNLQYSDIKFYIAELVLILEYLHLNGIAHRDLKPENIMIGPNGHLRIIDFGTAKFFNIPTADPIFVKSMQKMIADLRKNNTDFQHENKDYNYEEKSTFVGTAEYVAPELLEDSNCKFEADLWALGCILYRMVVGYLPFKDANEYLIFQKIKSCKYDIPSSVPEDAQSLIRSLIVRVPQKRLGANLNESPNGYSDLKSHKFFEGIDFENLFDSKAPEYEVKSPFKEKSPKKSQNVDLDSDDDLQLQDASKLRSSQTKPNDYKVSNFEEIKTGFNSVTQSKNVSLMTGMVKWKVFKVFSKDRTMILFSNAQIIIYKRGVPEMSMMLAKSTIKIISEKKFILWCMYPQRRFKFESIDQPASSWVNAIQERINWTIENPPINLGKTISKN